MTLREKISDDLKAAMKAGDVDRRDALRLFAAAIKQKEVDERIEIVDADVLSVIEKMLKQRRDSITQFEAAGRVDLANREKFEVSVLQGYMPQALSVTEIAGVVDAAIAATGAVAMKDMGKVMAALKERHAGQLDMSKASGLVKVRLG